MRIFAGLLVLLLLHATVAISQKPLFDQDLGNANYPKGVWTIRDGVLTASEDQVI